MFLDKKQFLVRENLWWALYHLRHTERTRVFWVDAICINQADDEERDQHVVQRKHIYQGARSMHVWVGREADNCETAISLLETLSHVGYLLLNLAQIYITSTFRRQIQLYDLKALHKLFDREAWHGVWIIPEAVLAAKIWVRCGSWTIRGMISVMAYSYR